MATISVQLQVLDDNFFKTESDLDVAFATLGARREMGRVNFRRD